jgi:hypothetical protein
LKLQGIFRNELDDEEEVGGHQNGPMDLCLLRAGKFFHPILLPEGVADLGEKESHPISEVAMDA